MYLISLLCTALFADDSFIFLRHFFEKSFPHYKELEEIGFPIERFPDKSRDPWSFSNKLRTDLQKLFSELGTKNSTILELGGYIGYSTAILSKYFSVVLSVEGQELNVRLARNVNEFSNNIIFLHTVTNDSSLYKSLKLTPIHVALIDAAHEYEVRTLFVP